jgi:hypothetical protein
VRKEKEEERIKTLSDKKAKESPEQEEEDGMNAFHGVFSTVSGNVALSSNKTGARTSVTRTMMNTLNMQIQGGNLLKMKRTKK